MNRNLKISASLLFLLLINTAWVQAQSNIEAPNELVGPITMSGDFTFASVGDLMIPEAGLPISRSKNPGSI